MNLVIYIITQESAFEVALNVALEVALDGTFQVVLELHLRFTCWWAH